jgi:hypothetical protein
MKDSKRTTAAALCAAALLAAICTPAAAATLAASDASWHVTATGPATGWDTSASFDDTAWQSATVLYDVSQYLGPAYAGTKGIWTQAGQFSTTDTTIWGRTVLNLAAVPQSATLEYGIDDDGDIFVNGALVVGDHNGIANGGLVDITSHLVAGANVIAFTATDNFAAWGYNHQAWIRVDGVVAAVPEPSTYAMFLLGLVAVGLVRGRSRRERDR